MGPTVFSVTATGRRETYLPVSYTHLDVYKRQVHDRLQVLHVHVFLVAPLGTRHMAQPLSLIHISAIRLILLDDWHGCDVTHAP